MMDLYGGKDPRELPAYGIAEAAHYLRIPPSTLRTWVRGRTYPTAQGEQWSEPVIKLADESRGLLSFVNLTEAHVLGAIRQSKVPFRSIRRGLDYLYQQFPSPHPLAEKDFETDGMDLFVDHLGEVVNITQGGQIGIREFLKTYLKRIERDMTGIATKLYLFNRRDLPPTEVQQTRVVVDPRISFGRPVLVGSHIATRVVYQRFAAGDSVEELAADYARPSSDIEEAIRCEQFEQAA